MKKFALAAALTFAASAGFAGTIEEPAIDPVVAPVVETDVAGSNTGWVIPVLLLAVVAAVAAG